MHEIDVRFVVDRDEAGIKETRVYPLTQRAEDFYEGAGYAYYPFTGYMPFACLDDIRPIEVDFGQEATEQGFVWDVVRNA